RQRNRRRRHRGRSRRTGHALAAAPGHRRSARSADHRPGHHARGVARGDRRSNPCTPTPRRPVRASSLFALSLALLAGLGGAAAVKLSGVSNQPSPKTEPPAPPPAVPPPPTYVLVAGRTLHPGDYVGPEDVRLRPLQEDEKADYQANHANYLPPVG